MKKRSLLCSGITLFLCLSLLAGCAGKNGTGGKKAEDDDALPPLSDDAVSQNPGDGRFSLRCDPDDSFNPYLCTGMTNELVSSLLYEGLFRLDRNFAVSPVLCESYDTYDGLTYTFKLKAGVKMSDGTAFTAADAAYSVALARDSSRWAGRLRHIVECIVEDDQTLIIKLDKENRSLPALLDFPMIAETIGDDDVPAGTGPYELNRGDMTLRARSDYHNSEKLPLDTIYLRVFSDEELTEAFADEKLDLIRDDPASGSASFRGNYEARRYTTTILQYIGFNVYNSYLDDPALRRAISAGVDRQTLITNVFGGSGVSAPLPIPSTVSWYSRDWEDDYADYAYYNLPSALRAIGMEDIDDDKLLEYPIGDGYFDTLSLRFLVNAETERKVQAAQMITQALINGGLDVRLEILPWDDFMKRLEEGSFELYYAETELSPDLDISDLVLPEGTLNYGDAGGEHFGSYIDYFLRAPDDEMKARTAGNLCEQFTENCPFIPVMFREYAVYTHRNAVTGLSPSVSGVFCGAEGLTITLD